MRANKYLCDRCGIELVGKGNVYNFQEPPDFLHFCDNCKEEFMKRLKGFIAEIK